MTSEERLGKAHEVFKEILGELCSAWLAYPRLTASAHEGFAILKEEVDELWEAIRMKQHYSTNSGGTIKNRVRRDAIIREAIQVAAMAIRLIVELNDE